MFTWLPQPHEKDHNVIVSRRGPNDRFSQVTLLSEQSTEQFLIGYGVQQQLCRDKILWELSKGPRELKLVPELLLAEE